MLHKILKNNDNELYCEKCDYLAKRKGDFKKHLESKKHKSPECYINATQKFSYCCPCGKKYKHHSSFYRHKSKCGCVAENEEPSADMVDVVSMLKEVMNENKKLQGQIVEMQSAHANVLHSIIPKIGNNNNNTNSNNKIINVQMFLNEKCADAMSIQHFAKQLEVTLDDVCKSKKDCITNVVLKNLQPLSLTQRPFHCTNPKSKEWYIKDENQGWEEDSGEKLLQNAEESIRKKWVCEFESRYPEWMENDQLRVKYVEIVGSTTAELPEKTKLKLLRELAGEVHLTKEDMV